MPLRLVAAAVLVAAVCEPCRAQLVQWRTEDGGNGHYYEISPTPATCWSNARSIGLSRGADLATLGSAAEQSFVDALLANRNPATGAQFIGLVEQGARHYVWVTGEPTTYTNWYPGEPNDGYGGTESVGSILWTQGQPKNGRSGLWNDVLNCPVDVGTDYGPGGYILEYPCEPAIVSQPSPISMCREGQARITITVGAFTGPYQYQWQRRVAADTWTNLFDGSTGTGSEIDGANSEVLTVAPLSDGDMGEYRCVVGNDCGSVTSSPALLTVCPPDFDCDGFISGADFDHFVQAFEAGDMSADFDGDGFITGLDFDLYVQAFEAGC